MKKNSAHMYHVTLPVNKGPDTRLDKGAHDRNHGYLFVFYIVSKSTVTWRLKKKNNLYPWNRNFKKQKVREKEKANMDARKKVGYVVEVHCRLNFTRCTYSSWRLQLV